ncbi:MAG: hypothetical protein M3126_04970 [Candidatus Eremiobacteraeota bacterium]|nr:hypothetical protein [Candidatus Eremiobacteraeota bacterium]
MAIALLAQVTLLHYFTFRGNSIGVVLVVVVWYAIHAGPRRSAMFGLAAGALEDLLDTGTGGAWTLSTTLTAILASVVSRGFFADSMPLVAGVVIFATLVRALVFWLVMGAQGYPTGLGWMHFHAALWQALINAAFILAVMLAGRYRESGSLR